MSDTILRTPLHGSHVALGGKMVPFAGYDMPVQYQGIIAETLAVRNGAGMFDVSHMARLELRGERALEFVEWMTTNDVSKLGDGAGQYSLLPNDRGGCVDDIILYRVSGEFFRMVVNAANHAKDVSWLRAHNSFGVDIQDRTDETAMIAVQGPQAANLLAGISSDPNALLSAPLFGLVEAEIGGVRCLAPRSGYTGEDGFELISAAEDGPRLWEQLRSVGVVPCGLGARDTLRVEAGLPLYGHELSDDLSPIAAGLGWVISKTKPFLGSEAIAQARAEGTPRKIFGLLLDSKRLLQPEMPVWVAGSEVGLITSGVYSPTLGRSIAFALLDSSVALDSPCEVDVRGKLEPGKIVGKRFLKR